MTTRLMAAMLRGAIVRSRATKVTDTNLISLISKLASQIGICTAPVAYCCDRISVPAVIGILKPVLLLPPSLLTNLSTSELTAILSHELAHIRSFDLFVQFFQKAIESLLFFHPVVWWLSRLVSNERENCCDDYAAAMGMGKVGYAAALLRIAELCLPKRDKDIAENVATLSVAGAGTNQLSRRIERLLCDGYSPMLPVRRVTAIVIMGSVAAITSIGVYNNYSQQRQTDSQPSVAVGLFNSGVMSMSDENPETVNEDEVLLSDAIAKINKQNSDLEIGLNQLAVTEEEVLDAIRRADWKRESGRLNQAEFAALKEVSTSQKLPKGSYLSAHSNQQNEAFKVEHFWRVQLHLPAIGHDGFVRFMIRDTKFADEIIAPEDIGWGDPDEDGFRLGIYLSPKKENYFSGERVHLRVFVRNDGIETVAAGWSRLAQPGPDSFTLKDSNGEAVPVILGQDEWRIGMVCGAVGGGLRPGGVHFYRVPFEIRIGGAETQNTNKLVGIILDAAPGASYQLSVRVPNGNYRKRPAADPVPESGTVSFGVIESKGLLPKSKTPLVPEKDRGSSAINNDVIPMDRVIWWDAGYGLEAGFLMTSPELPNQVVPLESVANYKILVRNKSEEEVEFLARLVPHNKADAPYLIHSDDINKSLELATLPVESRAAGGKSHSIEPAYVITLAPGESAIIPNQRAMDGFDLYVGEKGEHAGPTIAKIKPGMNWIVQPLQIHVPPPARGTGLLGRYTLTKVDREGITRREKANRRGAEPEGKIVYPRIQLDVGTLNAAAQRNADEAQWGDVDKGLQCGIRLLDQKPSYRVGDTMAVEILWRNTSATTILTPLPRVLDLYPMVIDANDRHRLIDFGARFNLIPATYAFKSGEIRSLGVTSIKLVADGTPSPPSNWEPGHLAIEPGNYKLRGSGGVSGVNTGSPTSGEIEFTIKGL